MSDTKLQFYPKLASVQNNFKTPAAPDHTRLEPSTCKEAEPFALRVLDDSMQPEFRTGCIIVIDPTGRATDGSYVLANTSSDEGPIFRQLRKNDQGEWSLRALNDQYPESKLQNGLDGIGGVIVQRAGARRSYHKRYD